MAGVWAPGMRICQRELCTLELTPHDVRIHPRPRGERRGLERRPHTPGLRAGSPSGPTRESTRECVHGWDSKAMSVCLSLSKISFK